MAFIGRKEGGLRRRSAGSLGLRRQAESCHHSKSAPKPPWGGTTAAFYVWVWSLSFLSPCPFSLSSSVSAGCICTGEGQKPKRGGTRARRWTSPSRARPAPSTCGVFSFFFAVGYMCLVSERRCQIGGRPGRKRKLVKKPLDFPNAADVGSAPLPEVDECALCLQHVQQVVEERVGVGADALVVQRLRHVGAWTFVPL